MKKEQNKEAIEAAKEFLTWQLGRSNRQEEDKLSSIIQSTIEKVADAAEKVSKMYFEIAAEAIGEDEVRRRAKDYQKR